MAKLVLSGRHHEVDLYISSVVRLGTVTSTIRSKNEKNSHQFKFFHAVEIDDDQVRVIVSKNMVDYVCKHGWILNLSAIRKIKGNIGKALYMYLAQQPGGRFTYTHICGLLGMQNNIDTRKKIKRALKELLAGGIICTKNTGLDDIEITRSALQASE